MNTFLIICFVIIGIAFILWVLTGIELQRYANRKISINSKDMRLPFERAYVPSLGSSVNTFVDLSTKCGRYGEIYNIEGELIATVRMKHDKEADAHLDNLNDQLK